MIEVKLSYSDFKAQIALRETSVQYIQLSYGYDLYLIDGALVLTTVAKDSADVTDFENNYKTTGNSKSVLRSAPFASKILESGESLFKRVHGVSQTIAAITTANIDFIVPYPKVKFSGAHLIGNVKGNTLDFTVHDTPTNTISGLDVNTYGANFKLNQFGYDIYMPDGQYENTSNYDADLYQDMIIRCTYTNNDSNPVTIGMNVELHEVKQ